MTIANIKALISKKSDSNNNKSLVLKDINRDLIVALLGISVYGKEARDENIMNIIINGGIATVVDARYEKIKTKYEKLVKTEGKKLKRSKDGTVKTSDGFMVLVPKQ